MPNQIKTVVGFILSILLMSCVPLGLKPPDLTLDDINGSWEGVFPLFLGYCRLEINSDGVGYFVIVFKEDDVEVLEIESISISGSEIEISLNEIEEISSESTLLKGVVWYDRMMLEGVSNKKTDNPQEKTVIRLMRNSSFNNYREIASDKLSELKKD